MNKAPRRPNASYPLMTKRFKDCADVLALFLTDFLNRSSSFGEVMTLFQESFYYSLSEERVSIELAVFANARFQNNGYHHHRFTKMAFKSLFSRTTAVISKL
jgi:hypothetical protein